MRISNFNSISFVAEKGSRTVTATSTDSLNLNKMNGDNSNEKLNNYKHDNETSFDFIDKDKDEKTRNDIANQSNKQKKDEKDTKVDQKVAEKVKEDTISQTHFDIYQNDNNRLSSNNNDGISEEAPIPNNNNNNKTIELDTSSEDPAEDLIREWEKDNKPNKLAPNFKKIAHHAATIHLTKGRGITVSDLEEKDFGKDYAEKLLPQGVD